MAGGGGVSAMIIDLPHFVGNGLEHEVGRDHLQHARRPTANRFVVAVGNWHVDAWAAIGGRTKNNPLIAETNAPGVVAGGADEFEICAIGIEAIKALRKAKRLAVDRAGVSAVADHAPDFVIQAIAQVVWT